ncbi:MAG: tRNA dihydrouridine synthase DusB [Candidatus Omnitrophica bacterium]|nr:tRNA dihydrouridine synthase DusB [Candidatus Omnitrophota bacterium]MDD5661201.1 tRNA dihydrouridine synthase DusB [Candidatus Omnitrophota bacterium]
MLEIGKLKLKSNLILAPMAGITDLPYRMVCRSFGAELAFVEMINCRSVSFKSRRTKQMLTTERGDKPLGVQILGSEEEYILKSLDVLKNYKFDILDFNAACPAKKVVRRGEGSGLLNDPKKLKKILKIIVKNSILPVSVKIRTGWDKDSVNARDIALLAEDCGVNALFIHGRTRTQAYSGEVDYGVIRLVKKALSIPLIASGDIFSGILAKKMIDETGCDGLAVARGSLGNPWIFNEIKEYLKNGKTISRPKKEDIAKVMLSHLDSSIDFYGQRNGVIIFRKFYSWYTKGLPKVRRLRERSSRVKTRQEIAEIIRQALKLMPGRKKIVTP